MLGRQDGFHVHAEDELQVVYGAQVQVTYGDDQRVACHLQRQDVVHPCRAARHGIHCFDLRAYLAQVNDGHIKLLADALQNVLFGHVVELDEYLSQPQLLAGLLLVFERLLYLLCLDQTFIQQQLPYRFAHCHTIISSFSVIARRL